MIKFLLTDKEAELIEVIRNIRRSFPNGYENLLLYARELFDDLVDLPKDGDDEQE